MTYNVAVVGATGNVGREILNTLSERKFPVNNIYAIASERSSGKQISFGDETITVHSLKSFDFSKTDLALFSPGSTVSAEFVPLAAKHCVVIDNTSHFRMDSDIPLIVPEVNLEELHRFSKRNIVANPNCAVIQLVLVLKPLHTFAHIKRVVITTFQSVSGAGKAAMDELYEQTKGKFMSKTLTTNVFSKQIAFNLIPQIGSLNKAGDSLEEIKIVQELNKILDPKITTTATCVRVPVFVGHSEVVNVEFERPVSPKEARELLYKTQGVALIDNPSKEAYITPIECVGDDDVYVSRIRRDESALNALNMWIVSDNIRKGAALNAVQIAEELVKNYI